MAILIALCTHSFSLYYDPQKIAQKYKLHFIKITKEEDYKRKGNKLIKKKDVKTLLSMKNFLDGILNLNFLIKYVLN